MSTTPLKLDSSDPWVQPGSPLYLHVRRGIAELIQSGEWAPGAAISPEKKLCERFGVSMGTLRKAVDELTASGLLVRQQGRGTFVSQHSQGRYLFSFFHLVGLDGKKEYPEVRFLKLKPTQADAAAAEALNLQTGAALLCLSNLLSLKGQAVSLDEIYLPSALYPGLTAAVLRGRQTTLYQMYQDDFGVTVVSAIERVRGVAATAAMSRLLEVEVGAPLLRIARTAYSFHHQPVELRYSYVNTQHCEYRPDAFVQEPG